MEALGVVFWEAMYANVPIVGSNVDGIVETIGRDGERGIIWSENKGQEGFKEIINSLSNLNNESRGMILRARKYVDEKILNNLIINDVV